MRTTEPNSPRSFCKATDYRGVIEAAWTQFQAVAKSEQRSDLVSNLEPAVHRLELGLFRLVVMGEIKKGKSTFINALLGEPELLPTASDVATSTVFKLLYGPEKRFKVFFLPDTDTDRRLEPKEIQASDLRDYGTEEGNKGNRKRVDFIGIQLPHPLLKEGLVIVDTPGVGGLFRAHRDITWRYAPNADAVCFVLDSVESIISKDEIAFLKELTGKVTRKIFFVQTKTDAADFEQSHGWEQRNKEHLTKHLGISPDRMLYFPVSSKLKAVADGLDEAGNEQGPTSKALKHLERSGFVPVLKFLNQGLMKQKEKHASRHVARQIQTACDQLSRQIREQLRIAQARSKDELDAIAGELKAAERKLTAWERDTYAAELRRFEDSFSRIRLQTGGRLRSELESAAGVGQLINHLQVSKPDPQLLSQQAGELQQAMLAQASEAAMLIEQEFNQQVIHQIKETAGRLAEGFRVGDPDVKLQACGIMPIPIHDTLNIEFSVFEKVRYGMMGAGMGYALASIVSLVIPVAMPITLLAGLIGGFKGYTQGEDQKRDQAIARLQQKLTETMMRAGSQAQQRFAEISQQLEQFARDTFSEAAKRARTELQGRIQDVQAARVRNSQEMQLKVKDLQGRLQRLSDIQYLLRPLLVKATAAK